MPSRRSAARHARYAIGLAVLAVAVPTVIAASDSTRYAAPSTALTPAFLPVSSRPPRVPPFPGGSPSSVPSPPVVDGRVLVPETIDASGGHDVTSSLDAFLASVPDSMTVVFPEHGRFRIEGTVTLKHHHDLIVDGQGSTFFALSNGSGKARPGCDRASSVCRYPNRTRSQWSFESDVNLLVHDVNVVGSDADAGPTGTYRADLEAQHAFQILGGRGIVLNHVAARDAWGDLVNVGPAQSGDVRSPTDVMVENSAFHNASRQGWSITNGQHVTFENNQLYSVRRSLIDVEANTAGDRIAYVAINDNWLGSYRFCTFTNYGAPGDEHDFVFSGNRSTGSSAIKICGQARPTARRRNFTIVDNVGAVGPRVPNEPMVSLAYFDNVTVEGNRQGFSSRTWPRRGGLNGSPQAPVTWTCSNGVVSGNRFTPRPSSMAESSQISC